MQSIIASAVKVLKKKQQNEAKTCIQRSQAKIKAVDRSGQCSNQQADQFYEQIEQFSSPSVYQIFGLNENLLGGRKIGRQKMPRIPKDSFFDNSLNFFQSINHQDEDSQNLNPEDHPFYYSQFEFMDYVKQQVQILDSVQKSYFNLIAQFQRFYNFQSKKQTLTDTTKLQNDLKINAKKNQTLMNSYQLEIKKGIEKLKKQQEQKLLILDNIQQMISDYQKQTGQLQTKKQNLKKSQYQFITIKDLKQRTETKFTTDKFQISIIKLQGTNTLFRYGAKITKSQISKADYLQKKCYKFQGKVKGIDILDLKVFILTTLYPMTSSIFNDFSSQSNIYKAMFGLNTLNKEETQSSLMILNKRVDKYLHQKKYHSLEQCLISIAKNRKKKIIFIGSIFRFRDLIDEIIPLLQNFNNNLLQIIKVSFLQVSNSYDGTNFSHHLLQINYTYQRINVDIVFDVLFCVPTLVSKQQIDMLRKKAHKFEQVLCWFQIPKAELQEQRIQTYRQINSSLNKTKLFYSSVQRQKGPLK